MLDKSQRVEKLCAELAPRLSLTADETKALLRAAKLSKAELVTKMVVEMTSLQGIMVVITPSMMANRRKLLKPFLNSICRVMQGIH
jgi:hypothetical protein